MQVRLCDLYLSALEASARRRAIQIHIYFTTTSTTTTTSSSSTSTTTTSQFTERPVVCVRELLWTLNDAELNLLEKSLCSTDDTDRSTAMLAELSGVPPELLLTVETRPITEFYPDDSSDTDDAASSRGLMVHSDSTMTVVARPAGDVF